METNYVVHVGVILKENLDALNMSQRELCKRINEHTTVINEIIKGKRGMNAKIANKLVDVFGLSAKFWMNVQAEYELAAEKDNVVLVNDDTLFEAGYTAIEVANRFISYEHAEMEKNEYYEGSLSPLKLQKLLYFAQKKALEKNIILFKDPIYNWTLGPVVKSVFNRYKASRHVIPDIVEDKPLQSDMEKLIKSTFEKYKKFTAAYMVEQSHKEKAWQLTQRDEEITIEIIRQYL